MSKPSDSAYPFPFLHSADSPPGLSKRELFAAMAMQGILGMLADIDLTRSFAECAEKDGMSSDEYTASNAVALADALLAELEKSNGTA